MAAARADRWIVRRTTGGEIDPTVQGGSLSSDQINQSASVFASDVMQALQSYGTTAPTAAGPSIVA